MPDLQEQEAENNQPEADEHEQSRRRDSQAELRELLLSVLEFGCHAFDQKAAKRPSGKSVRLALVAGREVLCGSSELREPSPGVCNIFSVFKEGLDVRVALNGTGVVRIGRTALRH